jgi:uncharacterized protein YhfF
VKLPAHVQPFWDEYQATLAADAWARFHEVFHFADSERVADELAQLVLAGTKRATASLVWMYEHEGTQPPALGSLSIMTDWRGTPLAIIEVTATHALPFEDVPASFAAREGEGDGSLEYWRDVHWRYFGRECATIGRTPDARMPVVCEQFVVVHPPRHADPR